MDALLQLLRGRDQARGLGQRGPKVHCQPRTNDLQRNRGHAAICTARLRTQPEHLPKPTKPEKLLERLPKIGLDWTFGNCLEIMRGVISVVEYLCNKRRPRFLWTLG